MANTLILIPSRLAATRLPGKPLLKINNLSIISHVFKRAEEANIGEVIVATEDKEIFDDVLKNGGNAILTNSGHKTGTDRIFDAYKKLNKKNVDYILNLQGDEPDINKNDIINLNNFMINQDANIGTLAAKIKDVKMLNNRNVVKVITDRKLVKNSFPTALNFTRDNLSADNQNIYGFVPFHGTPLRKMCEELGLIKPETITKCLTDKSILNMPQYPPHEIEEIKKCFSLYVKFPKNRWKEIERAEKNDKEGNRIYENLREEYLATYMPKPDANPHGGSESFDDIEDPYFGTKASKENKATKNKS